MSDPINLPPVDHDGNEVKPYTKQSLAIGRPDSEQGETQLVSAWGHSGRYPTEEPHMWALNPDGAWMSAKGAHRVMVDVEFRTWNRRDYHDWKGFDDLRAAGEWRLMLNRGCVATGGASHPLMALDQIRARAEWYLGIDSPINFAAGETFDTLIGRKVFYREHAGTITSTIPDQGCVTITAFDPRGFPPPVWAADDDMEAYNEYEDTAKVEVWSPHIWWWRKKDPVVNQ